MWPRVHKSGRTSIRATTRSGSASVKVTPFSSAKGIFIALTFSSGVMSATPFVYQPSFRDGPKDQTRNLEIPRRAIARLGFDAAHRPRNDVLETIAYRVKPGND